MYIRFSVLWNGTCSKFVVLATSQIFIVGKFSKSYFFPVFRFQHEPHLISLELKGSLPHCSHSIVQNTETALPKAQQNACWFGVVI